MDYANLDSDARRDRKLLRRCCDVLQIVDNSALLPALTKVVAGVRRIPKMDKFIRDVFHAVCEVDNFERGHDTDGLIEPVSALPGRRLGDAVPMIRRWGTKMNELNKLRVSASSPCAAAITLLS